MPRHTAAAAVLAAPLLALALTACGSSDDKADSKPAPAPITYKIAKQDTSGNQRQVTVEVPTAKGLRAVFDVVTDKLKGDAGYFVSINCTTGGSKASDNRLANGRYARGNTGVATTGLKDGEKEFETVEGATCPDKS